MSGKRRAIAAALSVAAVLLAVEAIGVRPSSAVPRYSALYEQRCALCHVNPSGGGMRTPYASQKLVPEEIARRPARPALLKEIDPHLGKQLMIGTDFRELWLGSDDPAGLQNFFEMQSDLYFAFQLDPKVTLYYDRGQSASYELFGLDYVLPTLYLKAGRFVPSYGWRFDDHTMYVRTELGLQPPANSDVGLEAGFSRGPLDVQVGIVNGNRGGIFDDDKRVAAVANVVRRFHAGPFALALGAAGYHQPTTGRRYGTAGPYGYLVFKELTWLGEVDVIHQRDPAGRAQDGVATSHELSWRPHQGIELLATYDFFDPDRFKGSGAKWRWGGGIHVMPRSYATIDALVRRTQFRNGPGYSGIDFTEPLIQLHLLY